LIKAIRFNQACTTHIQVVTTGATNYTRRPVVAKQRLVVKPTRTPVIAARIYIRQWIRSCTKATSGERRQRTERPRYLYPLPPSE
ncbi:hypothetical protein J6Z37_01455, partial [Candidatus Saccharibacteria bacterium]|nr:hypothetical protein [Candidatus Saccharibacteria bacterium]